MKQKVMIASRFKEFAELRPKLASKLNNSKYIEAVALDDNQAFNESALERSLSNIRKAKIVILLVGDTYGDILPGKDISYTHAEYREAKNTKSTHLIVYCIGKSYRNKNIVFSDDCNLRKWQEEIFDGINGIVPALYGDEEDIDQIIEKIKDQIHDILFEKKGKIDIDPLLFKTNSLTTLLKQYDTDISRIDLMELVYSEITRDKSVWVHLYGKSGIGKSSILANTSKYFIDRNKDSIVYFIENEGEVSIHIERIYLLLKDYISNIVAKNDFNLIDSLDSIKVDIPSYEKLSILKYKYLESDFYQDTKFEIIIFIDGLDTLDNQNKFITQLLGSENGFSYITSSQNYFDSHIGVTIRNKNSNINICFENDETIGKEIGFLDRKETMQYVYSRLSQYDNLSDDIKNKLADTIFKQSEGWPIFVKQLVIEMINYISKQNNINEIVNFVIQIPNDLQKLFIKQIKEAILYDSDTLNLLCILFWFNTSIPKNYFAELSNKSILEINSFIEKFDNLIIESKDGIKFYHNSVYKILFDYISSLNENYFGTYIDQEQFNILSTQKSKYVVDLIQYGKAGYQLRNIKVMNKNHPLYITLEQIAKYFLEKKKLVDMQALNIYKDFILSTLFLVHPKIKSRNDLNLYETLYEKETDYFLESFLYKIFIISEINSNMSMQEREKLHLLSYFSKNNFLKAYSLNKFWIKKVGLQINHIISQEHVSKSLLETVSSNLSWRYITAEVMLNNLNIDQSVKLYKDNGLFLLLKKSNKGNDYTNIFNEAERIFSSTNENFDNIKKFQHIVNSINGSQNIELYVYFIDRFRASFSNINLRLENNLINDMSFKVLLLDIKNIEKYEILHSYFAQYKFNELCSLIKKYENQEQSLDEEVNNIFSFLEEDILDIQYIKQYRTLYSNLSEEYKLKLSKLQKIRIYYENGNFSSLFEEEYIEYSPYLLNSNDELTFFNRLNNLSLENDRYFKILNLLGYISNNKEVLNNIFNIISNKSNNLSRSDLNILILISIKLENKKYLKKLYNRVIKYVYLQDVNRFLNKLNKYCVFNENIEAKYIKNKASEGFSVIQIFFGLVENNLFNLKNIKKYLDIFEDKKHWKDKIFEISICNLELEESIKLMDSYPEYLNEYQQLLTWRIKFENDYESFIKDFHQQFNLSKKLTVGFITKGKITKITDFGAFLILDNQTGLLHNNELSNNEKFLCSDIFKIGQEITVKVIAKNKEGKIQLSRKNIPKYFKNDLVKGYITGIMDYGVFLKLDDEYNGLIKNEDLLNKDKKKLAIGDEIKAVVKFINKEKMIVNLSEKKVLIEKEENKSVDNYLQSINILNNLLKSIQYKEMVLDNKFWELVVFQLNLDLQTSNKSHMQKLTALIKNSLKREDFRSYIKNNKSFKTYLIKFKYCKDILPLLQKIYSLTLSEDELIEFLNMLSDKELANEIANGALSQYIYSSTYTKLLPFLNEFNLAKTKIYNSLLKYDLESISINTEKFLSYYNNETEYDIYIETFLQDTYSELLNIDKEIIKYALGMKKKSIFSQLIVYSNFENSLNINLDYLSEHDLLMKEYLENFVEEKNIFTKKDNFESNYEVLFEVFKLFILLKKAESIGNEEEYKYFSEIMMKLIVDVLKDIRFKEKFNWLTSSNINLIFDSFSAFDFKDEKEKTELNAQQIKEDYVEFYNKLSKKYNLFMCSDSIEEKKSLENTLEKLMIEIREDEDIVEELFEVSNIQSKLQIKIDYIDSFFKPLK